MLWCRLYANILDQPELRKITSRSFKIMIFAMLYLTEIDSNDGIIANPLATFCWRARIRKPAWERFLIDIQKISKTSYNLPIFEYDQESDVLIVKNWSKLQYKSDFSTLRVKKHRKNNPR